MPNPEATESSRESQTAYAQYQTSHPGYAHGKLKNGLAIASLVIGIVDLFTLAGFGQTNTQIAGLMGSGSVSLFPLLTEFAHTVSAQVQTGHALDVQTGQVTDFSGTYHVLNDCRRTHYFEFRTSDTRWLHLAVQKQAEIPAHVSLPVEATVRIDATQLAPGQYRTDRNLESGSPVESLHHGFR